MTKLENEIVTELQSGGYIYRRSGQLTDILYPSHRKIREATIRSLQKQGKIATVKCNPGEMQPNGSVNSLRVSTLWYVST